MCEGDVRMSKCPFHNMIKNAYPEECKNPDRLVIVANNINNHEIEKANQRMDWMDNTPNRFANRCLPLLSANELGWVISCPKSFTATWNGDESADSIIIEYDGNPDEYWFVTSHFGSGVLTFHPGFMFQTTKGHGLYVKGPTNRNKPSIYPLEGLVETDWLTFTFTMNWRFTEKNKPVVFEEGEPFCQFFPYPRDYVNKFETIKKQMSEGTYEAYSVFSKSREEFNDNPDREGKDWQKNYFQGKYHDGTKCEEFGFKHEPKCNASKFK
jgi:hypothetical protein